MLWKVILALIILVGLATIGTVIFIAAIESEFKRWDEDGEK